MNGTTDNVVQLFDQTPNPDLPPPLVIPADRETYTVAEVAYLLRLSLGNTYALLRDGTIPARKVGARWIISRHRFRHWLDNLPEATDEDFEREMRRYEREQRRTARPAEG